MSKMGENTYYIADKGLIYGIYKDFKKLHNNGASTMAQWVKLLPVVLASHINAGSSPKCTSNPIPC